jgi:protein-disulfide isomerase
MTNARTAKSTREKAAQMRIEEARRQARRRARIISATVAAVLVLIVAVVAIVRVAQADKTAKDAAAAAPPANLTDNAFLTGKPAAKVTIDVYEDFQCPACRQFEQGSTAQLAKWAADGTAKVMYRPVAILDRASSTAYSTRAANAAAAVINSSPTAFVKFHDLLFANQPEEGSAGLPDSQLIDLAVQAGAPREPVEAAVTTQKFKGWTISQTEGFSAKKFTGTPTILVNGKKLSSYDPKVLVDEVTKAAAAAKS